MIKLSSKNRITIIGSFLLIVLYGLVYFPWSRPQRTIASRAEKSVLGQLKFNWNETENGIVFRLGSKQEGICNLWSSLDIVFRAEGIAYSGEVDRVVQTSSCEEGSFQQTWVPRLMEIEGSQFQKIGYFREEPPEWVLEQIILVGKNGTEIISSDQVVNEYGNLPSLKTNPD